MTASNTALVAPNERLAARELVNIEFERLRRIRLRYPEIHVIGETVQRCGERVIVIGQPYGREGPDKVIVPEYVAPLCGSTTVV